MQRELCVKLHTGLKQHAGVTEFSSLDELIHQVHNKASQNKLVLLLKRSHNEHKKNIFSTKITTTADTMEVLCEQVQIIFHMQTKWMCMEKGELI